MYVLGGEEGEHRVPPALVSQARRMGPLPWSALGAAPAREQSPDLGGWLARALDRMWVELGRPDPLVVVDVGAADASRAAGVLEERPGCAPALRWLLVQDRPDRRLSPAPGGLRMEDPALVLGPAVPGDDPDGAPATPPGIGPLAASLRDLPSGLPVAVVLAIGWLGRLPADRFEWRDGRWWEIRLKAGATEDVLVELTVEAGGRAPAGTGSIEGERRCDPSPARRWLASARRLAAGGRVLAIEALSQDLLSLDQVGPAPRRVEALPPLLAAEWSMRGVERDHG